MVKGLMLKVLHLRDQIQTGLQLADRCMERRCMMLCTDKPTDSLSTFMRRVVQEASQCFPEAELQCTHHIGYLDTTKYGRLGMPEINEMASWTLRTLNLKPERSSLVFNFTWYVCNAHLCLTICHTFRHGHCAMPCHCW